MRGCTELPSRTVLGGLGNVFRPCWACIRSSWSAKRQDPNRDSCPAGSTTDVGSNLDIAWWRQRWRRSHKHYSGYARWHLCVDRDGQVLQSLDHGHLGGEVMATERAGDKHGTHFRYSDSNSTESVKRQEKSSFKENIVKWKIVRIDFIPRMHYRKSEIATRYMFRITVIAASVVLLQLLAGEGIVSPAMAQGSATVVLAGTCPSPRLPTVLNGVSDLPSSNGVKVNVPSGEASAPVVVLKNMKKSGKSNLLSLTVNQVKGQRGKILDECFVDGRKVWSEYSRGSFTAFSGEGEVKGMLKQVNKKIAKHIGGPGLSK